MCGRMIDGGFQGWWINTGQTNRYPVYPNVVGSGSRSLAVIELFTDSEIQHYSYVPGLREGDPAELVLMFLKARTAYTWHADYTHTVLSTRRWMVLSPDPLHTGTCPEGGELLDTPEFKRRLEKTIAFLKEHQRPYWQVVVEEQSKFLRSLED